MKPRQRMSLPALGLMLAGAAVPLSAMADEQTEELRRSLEEHGRQLEVYKQRLAEQEARVEEMRRAVAESQRQIDALLGQVRGAGTAPAAAVRPAASPERIELPTMAQAGTAQQQRPVGQAPTQDRPKEVAQIFEQPGILTPRGKVVLEPGLQFAYSSSSRVALSGFTIIPSLLIGVVDVREVKRETWTASLTGRYGITNRFEVEARVPWVYRRDSVLARPIGTGEATDSLFETNVSKIGDVELTGRYQLNDGGADKPYYVGWLKFKTRTGRDPFEATKVASPSPGGAGLDEEPPTGSGFYSLTPGVTFLLPSDPVVLFGGLSYTYNFKRKDVDVPAVGGLTTTVSEVKAGDILGFNFGMGLALNEKSSLSLGYDHSVVGKTKIESQTASLSQRVHLGTLLIGYSYRYAPNRNINLSLGMGATRDAADAQITLRMPYSF